MILKLTLLLLTITNTLRADSTWNYKFAFTTNINSQLSINCDNTNDVLWIGWSHYGTRNNLKQLKEHSTTNFPNEHDCWMNFTEKIAEQCNGAQQCDLSSQPTYIHKCGKISDYLYVSFKCVQDEKIFDVCKQTTQVFKLNDKDFSFYLKSTDFPTEYPSSLDCSCSISSKSEQSLKIDVLWFSLQDNDYLNLFNKNLTGWINPTYEMPIMSKQTTVRFTTDDGLAYKGFWLKVSGRKACRDDWQLVGDQCVKVFTDPLDWRSANQRCQQMNGYLIKIDDVISDLKLTQYMKTFYAEINSYWIGLRKYVDQYSQERWMWSNNSTNYNDVSWWPWRKANQTNDKTPNCVVKKRNEDGYFAITCDSSVKNSFICQTETINPIRDESNIKLQCGATETIEKQLLEVAEFEKIGSVSIKNYELKQKAKIIATTQSSTTTTMDNTILKANLFANNEEDFDSFIKSDLSTTKPLSKIEHKLNTAVIGMVCGIGFVIVLINLGILFICRRNLKKLLKSTKDQHQQQPRDDMIQDYFEAFNTFHNLNKGQAFKSKLGLSEQQHKTLTLLHNQLPNSDDSMLIHESAQLFYNPQQFTRDIPVRQTQSAFKPFNRDESQQTLNHQQLIETAMAMQQRQLFLQQQQQQNPYDKISHQAIQSVQKFNKDLNNSAGQYAHTYECLDSLEVPNRRVNSNQFQTNYRTMNTNDSGIDTTMMLMMMNSLQSPQINDVNFNNSSSSASSTSGTSITQQLIPHHQQQQQQIITLNDLKHLNHLILNNNSNQTVNLLKNNLIGDNQTILNNGTWSPDSAYYSSIPTLTNYSSNNSNNLQQQLNIGSFNSNNLNESFKSHLV